MFSQFSWTFNVVNGNNMSRFGFKFVMQIGVSRFDLLISFFQDEWNGDSLNYLLELCLECSKKYVF